MKSLILLILAILLLPTLLFYFVYLHESAHQEIYNDYNIKSEIHFLNFKNGGAYTLAENRCPTESCFLAQEINDDIGYNLFPIYVLIGCLGLIIITFQYLNGGK